MKIDEVEILLVTGVICSALQDGDIRIPPLQNFDSALNFGKISGTNCQLNGLALLGNMFKVLIPIDIA